jgi:hypothetical protein
MVEGGREEKRKVAGLKRGGDGGETREEKKKGSRIEEGS